MYRTERIQQVENLINQKNFITIKDLATSIGISEATTRRDVEHLHNGGLVKKVPGGVVSVSQNLVREPELQAKQAANVEEKERITQAAVQYIEPGNRIILDSGSTLQALARKLKGFENLMVITYDLIIAMEIAKSSSIELLMAGGLLRKSYYSFCGYFTERTFSEIHVDKVFISCDAFDIDQGIMSYTMDDLNVKRQIIKSADEVILLCDHSKLDVRTFISIYGVEAISRMITGRESDPELVERFRRRGLKVEMV